MARGISVHVGAKTETLVQGAQTTSLHRDRHRALRRSIALLLPLLLAVPVDAQQAERSRVNICTDARLSPAVFARVLSQRFSSLVGIEPTGVPGTSISVNSADGAATVTQSFVAENGRVLTVVARGATNDGILAAFDGRGLAPSFGGSAEYHWLGRGQKSLSFDVDLCQQLQAKLLTAESAYTQRIAESALRSSPYKRQADSTALEGKRVAHSAAYQQRRAAARTPMESLAADTLWLELAKDSAALRLLARSPRIPIEDDSLHARNTYDSTITALQNQVSVMGLSFGWWTLSASVDKANFSLFDSALAPDSQITKDSFLSRSAQLKYSWIRQSPFSRESRYLSLAGRVGLENNLSQLTKSEVIDRQTPSASVPTRVTEKKSTVYSGPYVENVAAVRLSADYYQFFVANDRVAYHVFPELTVREGFLPRASLGAGLVFSGYDPSKKKSRINMELFSTVPNVIGGRSVRPLTKTITGGIRLSLPLDLTSLR